jgi:hypothetical protein
MGEPLKRKFENESIEFRGDGYQPGVSDGEAGGRLREDPKPELIALLYDPFVQLADIRPKPFNGLIKRTPRQHLISREKNPTP